MSLTRRRLLIGGGAVAGAAALAVAMRDNVRRRLDRLTILPEFSATPPPTPHDAVRDRTQVWLAQGGGPVRNTDDVINKFGGMARVVGVEDVVVVKVSAQWWNQGMTNVAAARRVIEHICGVPGFRGEVIVIENTHFAFPDVAEDDPRRGLTRAWTHPSDANVDVAGWSCLGDLIPDCRDRGLPVSFVGLVDAGTSSLASSHWFDPTHAHGVYGGDGRGPLRDDEARDGYHWDFSRVFRLARSRVADAQTPLTWPRFTSPRSGLVVDLRDGVFRREGGRLVKTEQAVCFINLTTANEHGSTGVTGACKSTMGLVDMSAGALGTHPLARGYQSIHYFGRTGRPDSQNDPTWRMAGPLAYWSEHVIRPALILTVGQWVAITPHKGYDGSDDMRQHASCRVAADTIIAGTDPVAIDATLVRRVLMPAAQAHAAMLNLNDADSKVSRFLSYYRQVAGKGTLDEKLIEIV